MKKIYALLAACLLSMSAAWADYKTIYTLFDSKTGTLTYYYDYWSKCNSDGGEEYDPNVDRFKGYSKDVKKIVIDNSVSLCDMLKTTQNFFFSGAYDERFVNLTEIEGMTNLKTQNVTDMRNMFYGCSSLTSIDLSRLDTRKVKYMDAMFSGCASLEELDLKYFWTHSVEQMSFMFDGCKALKKVNLSSFRTENVKYIDCMFSDCESLTELDLSLFDMRQVVDNYAMFSGCKKLKTIYCNDDLKTNDDLEGNDMFEDCVSLVGEYGTTFDPDHTNIEYARRDTENGKKGYFTSKPETFVVLDENTKALYYWCGVGRKLLFPKSLPAPLQITDDEMEDQYVNQVKEVVYSQTMSNSDFTHAKDLMPRTANHVVKPFKAATKVTGVENINTSVLTNWEMMFYHMNITEMDLTKVDMGPVTDVTNIFAGCENLETIYCNEDWNERKEWKIWVGDGKMFQDCYKLKGGKGTTYDADHQGFSYAHPDELGNPGYFTATLSPKEIYAVFNEEGSMMTLYYDRQKEERGGITNWQANEYNDACAAVQYIYLDASMQNAKPTTTSMWFYGFKNTAIIYNLNYLNTSDVKNMNNMFMYCEKLKTIDLSSFNTEKVTDMSCMFGYCEALKRVDLSGFNTSNVEDMKLMFTCCKTMTSIDVRSFDVSKVKSMRNMFYHCINLRAIYGTEDWSVTASNVESSGSMFEQCFELPHYDAGNANDITFAHPDEEGNPGYFCTTTPKILYGAYDNYTNELTIFYDEHKDENAYSYTPNEWYGADWINGVNKVVIDESVKDVQLTSTEDWFNGFTNLREFEHFDYLDFSQVSSTAFMFSGCQILPSFSFPKEGDTYMLEPRDVSGMFANCAAMETIDLTGLSTYNCKDLRGMFFGCTYLKTIYCNDDWSDYDDAIAPEDRQTEGIFYGCNWLVGQNGTPYAGTLKSIEYARPDKKDAPGYFTEKKPQGMESIQQSDVSIQKVLRDGQLYIQKGDQLYDAQGKKLKK